MIERARYGGDHVGRKAVDVAAHPDGFFTLLRRRRIAAHRFWTPRGARRVDHAVCGRRRQVFGGLVGSDPIVPVLRLGGNDALLRRGAIGGRQFRRRRHDEHVHARWHDMRDCMQEIGMHDENARAAILQNIFDLLRLEMPIDRHGIGAELLGCDRGFEESEIVAQEERDGIAGAHANVAKTSRRARCAVVELGARQMAVAADEAVVCSSGHHLLFLLSSSRLRIWRASRARRRSARCGPAARRS